MKKTAAVLGAWWLACAGLAVWSYVWKDPPVPGRSGTSLYGHNAEGQLQVWLAVMAVELLLLLLGALKLKRTWPGLVLVAPASVFFTFLAMHQSTVYFAHLFWLWGALLVLMLVGSFQAIARLSGSGRPATR